MALVVEFVCDQVEGTEKKIRVVVPSKDDCQTLQIVLGERAAVMTKEQEEETDNSGDFDIIFYVDVQGRMNATWNVSISSVPRIENVQVFLNYYPDGLALLLLVDAILHLQNKSNWSNDWKRFHNEQG